MMPKLHDLGERSRDGFLCLIKGAKSSKSVQCWLYSLLYLFEHTSCIDTIREPLLTTVAISVIHTIYLFFSSHFACL